MSKTKNTIAQIIKRDADRKRAALLSHTPASKYVHTPKQAWNPKKSALEAGLVHEQTISQNFCSRHKQGNPYFPIAHLDVTNPNASYDKHSGHLDDINKVINLKSVITKTADLLVNPAVGKAVSAADPALQHPETAGDVFKRVFHSRELRRKLNIATQITANNRFGQQDMTARLFNTDIQKLSKVIDGEFGKGTPQAKQSMVRSEKAYAPRSRAFIIDHHTKALWSSVYTNFTIEQSTSPTTRAPYTSQEVPNLALVNWVYRSEYKGQRPLAKCGSKTQRHVMDKVDKIASQNMVHSEDIDYNIIAAHQIDYQHAVSVQKNQAKIAMGKNYEDRDPANNQLTYSADMQKGVSMNPKKLRTRNLQKKALKSQKQYDQTHPHITPQQAKGFLELGKKLKAAPEQERQDEQKRQAFVHKSEQKINQSRQQNQQNLQNNSQHFNRNQSPHLE